MRKTLDSLITKKHNKNLFWILLALLLSLMVLSVSMSFFNSNKKVVQANSIPPTISTQALNGADKDVSFAFIAEEEISESNFLEFVDLQSIRGEKPDYRFEKGNNNKFTILAPKVGYIEGDTYVIRLKKAFFENKEIRRDEDFYFSIKNTPICDVRFEDNVKQVGKKSEAILGDNNFVKISNINGNELSIGDILVIPYNRDNLNDLTLKIDRIVSKNNESIEFYYSLPEAGEVVSHAEIYGDYKINFSEKDFALDWENAISEQIINLPYVQTMDEVANSVYKTKFEASKGFPDVLPGWTKIIPQIKVKMKTWQPLDMIIEVIWTSKNLRNWNDAMGKKGWLDKIDDKTGSSNKINFEVKIELEIKNETSTKVIEKNGVKNTSTLDTSSIGLKVSAGAGFEADIAGEFKRHFEQVAYNEQKETASEEDENRFNIKPVYPNSSTKKKEKQRFHEKLNEGIDARNAKRKTAREFVDAHDDPKDESEPKLKIFPRPIAIPIIPGYLTFNFDLEFFFKINLNAELGTQHIWKSTTEKGTIEYKGKTDTYHNEITEYSGNVGIRGSINIRTGFKGYAFFDFIGLIKLGVNSEVGLYFEAEAIASIAWGNGYNNKDYDAKPWAANLDVGWYYNFTAFTQILFFEPFEWTFYEKKISFFGENKKIGQDNMYDLVTDNRRIGEFEGDLGVESDLPVINFSDNGYCEIPKLYKSVYKISNGEGFVEEIPLRSDQYKFKHNDYVYYDGGRAFLRDSSIQEFEDIVYVYLLVDGEVDENTFLPIVIKKEPTKVEKIIGYTDFDGVQVGGKINLSSKCEPQNASYQESDFKIDYIIKDGVTIESDFAQYAFIDEMNMLNAKNTLKIGDKIIIRAHAKADDIWSEPFEVSVIKKPVSEVRIIAEDFLKSISPGKRVEIFPKVYPLDATCQVDSVYLSEGESYGKIVEENGKYFLECYEETEIGSTIKIKAIADDGDIESEEYEFRVGAVPVEKIDIEDEFGNKFLERKNNINKIQQGASIKLKQVYSPNDATVVQGEFYLTSGDLSAKVDNDGNLVINKRAPIGTIISVVASAEGINSSEYSFEVVKIPVEKIELKNYQDAVTVKPGESLQFYPVVSPSNASYISPVYKITEGNEFANISAYGTLTISQYAEIGSKVKITASSDGVVSDEFIVTIEPILAERIDIFASNNTIKEGDGLQLSYVINPLLASYAHLIEFEIVEGNEYASVDNSGYITINDNIPVKNAVIKVRAKLDNVFSNELEFSVFVPVKKVEIVFDSGDIKEMQVYMSEKFSANVSPSHATNAENVKYIVTNNKEFVTLKEAIGGCYVTVNENAIVGDKFSIAAIVDGVQSEDYFITIVKTPVIRIDIESENVISLGEGKSYSLNAFVYPQNATYKDISYKVTIGYDIADIVPLSNGRFTLEVQTGMDKLGSEINVIASADGVDSKPMRFVVTKNAVEFVKIVDTEAKTTLRPGETTKLEYEVNADATYTSGVYRITNGSEFAIISQDGTIRINENILVPNAKVSVAVTVDGTTSNEITYDIFVPTSNVFIYSNISNAYVGEEFKITCEVNQNSSDKRVNLTLITGHEYLEKISLDEFGQAIYKVKDNILIPNAEATFKATAQGVESYVLTVNLIVPVKTVQISSSNNKPMQGQTSICTGRVMPTYATFDKVSYNLAEDVVGIKINNKTGEVFVEPFVEVGTKFYVVGVADGIVSQPIEFIVQKVPVSKVVLSEINNISKVRVGESVNLAVKVFPENATYKKATYSIIEKGTGITIDKNGKVDITLAAIVDAIVKIKAVVDGVESNIYELTLLKQPVSSVQLEIDSQNSYGKNIFTAGSVVKLFASVNENASYPDISFEFLDSKYIEYCYLGSKIGDIQEFIFKIKNVIDIPNATITFYAEADKVRSKQLTIAIYNKAEEIRIDRKESGKVYADNEFRINVTTNNGLNNATTLPILTVVQGNEFINELSYGIYKVKPFEELAEIFAREPSLSKVIKIKASGDGVESNIIEIELYIDVNSIEFTSVPQSITIGDENSYVLANITPECASNKTITYSITNQVDLPFITINSLTGKISVQNNKAYIDKKLIVRASAYNGLYVECEIEIKKVQLIGLEITDTVTEVLPGGKAELFSTPNPFNATFADNLNDVTYEVISGDAFVKGNILTVRYNAVIDSEIIIVAKADGVESANYTISVKSAPESDIKLNSNNTDLNNVMCGQKIQFNVDIKTAKPDEEPNFPVRYWVSDGAVIDANGLLTINSRLKNNSIITVYAEAVGVTKSITLTVRVPVKVYQSKAILNENESDSLVLENADLFTTVNYRIESGYEHLGTIDGNGEVKFNLNVKGNSIIKAYAEVDGIKSKVLSWALFVQVKNLSVSSSSNKVMSYTTQAIMDSKTDDKVFLYANFNDQYSSNTSLRFLITEGREYIVNCVFLNGNYYVLDNFIQAKTNVGIRGKRLSIVAEVYGLNGDVAQSQNNLIIDLIIPVESVTISRDLGGVSSNEKLVQQGMSYSFNASVYPTYATDSAISFSAINSSIGTLAQSGNKCTLKIANNATIGAAIQISASAGGISQTITVNIETVYASDLSIAEIESSKQSGTANLNKVYAGDILTVHFQYSSRFGYDNVSGVNQNAKLSFNPSSIVTSNSCARIVGSTVEIFDLNSLYTDNPQFTLYAFCYGENGTKISAASKFIKVYVPVESMEIGLKEANRGETNSLNIKFNTNGYASNKTLSVKNLQPSGINFDGINRTINLPKNLPAGTKITGTIYSADGTSVYLNITVKALTLTKDNVYYSNDPNKYNSTSKDSGGRTMYSNDNAQLEENKYTYVLGKYKEAFLSDYGVTYKISESSDNAELSNCKLSIKQNAPGNETVTLNIEFDDGGKKTQIAKKVKIFNAINTNAISPSSTKITKASTKLSLNTGDNHSTYQPSQMKFEKAEGNNYTVLSDGNLTISKDTSATIKIKIYCDEMYNGQILASSYSKIYDFNISITSSKSYTIGSAYNSGGLGTSFGGWKTVDTISNSLKDDAIYSDLRDLGYTKLDMVYSAYFSVNGAIEYNIRLFDETTQKELAIIGNHDPGNGGSHSRSVTFSNIDLSSIIAEHTIVIQMNYRKTVGIWAGDFKISADRTLSVSAT